jgi:hypothetical protein
MMSISAANCGPFKLIAKILSIPESYETINFDRQEGRAAHEREIKDAATTCLMH